MRRTIRAFTIPALCFAIAIIASACKDSGFFDPVDSELTPLSGDVLFTVQETHDPSGARNSPVPPFIQLSLETEKAYSCSNFRLVSDLTKSTNKINVKLHGVDETGICLTALGPARNEFALDVETGDYLLDFNYWNKNDKIALSVTDSSLVVNELDTSFMVSQTDTFWRYPEQSFAYFCDAGPEGGSACEDFRQILNDSLTIESFSFPDYGTIPYPQREDYDITTYYTYPDKDEYEKAGRLLNNYAENFDESSGVHFYIINWKNRAFRSWTDLGE